MPHRADTVRSSSERRSRAAHPASDTARSAAETRSGRSAPCCKPLLTQITARADRVDERDRGTESRQSHGLRCFRCDEQGAVTAEYAVVILAGVAFAGLLIAVIRSEEVRTMLVDLVQQALGSAG